MAHSVVLLSTQVQELQEANTILSKCKRAKRTCLQEGGALSIQDAQDFIDQRDVSGQLQHDMAEWRGPEQKAVARKRRCGKCRETGHDARTCEDEYDASDPSYS